MNNQLELNNHVHVFPTETIIRMYVYDINNDTESGGLYQLTSPVKSTENIKFKKYLFDQDLIIIRNQQTCSICLEMFEKNKEDELDGNIMTITNSEKILLDDSSIINVCRLGCFHHYHIKCIEKWLESNTTCPYCRSNCSINPDFNSCVDSDYVSTNESIERNITLKIISTNEPIDNNIPIRFHNSSYTMVTFSPDEYDTLNLSVRDSLIGVSSVSGRIHDGYRHNVHEWILLSHDIELVSSQTNKSLKCSAKAIVNNNYDVVNAIIDLTM